MIRDSPGRLLNQEAPTVDIALVVDAVNILDVAPQRWLKPQMYAATADT